LLHFYCWDKKHPGKKAARWERAYFSSQFQASSTIAGESRQEREAAGHTTATVESRERNGACWSSGHLFYPPTARDPTSQL